MKMLWFRVIMMTCSLVFVIYAIRNMNNQRVQPYVAATLGINPSVTPKAAVGVKGSLNWCETRVSSLKLASQTEIRQEKLKWFKITPEGKTEMHPLSMEKWFSRHCTVATELTWTPDSMPPDTRMKISFVKGEPQNLQQYKSGEFVWRGQTFRSPELSAALKDLELLR